MNTQVKNIYIHVIASIFMLICAFILLYTCIYVYVGVFWLAFGFILHQFISLYMHICRPYMHILGLEIVYMAHRYIFGKLICLFACLFFAAYMQIYANVCK